MLGITLNDMLQSAIAIMAVAVSCAAWWISHLQYAGSPPIGLITGWQVLEQPADPNARIMRLSVKFWNHRKYALEVADSRLVVPNTNIFRILPTNARDHGFDTARRLIPDQIVLAGEAISYDFVTPYKLQPGELTPYPFAVALGYLDPRKGKYKTMWIYSPAFRPGRLRRLRDRFADLLLYPILLQKIRWSARSDRIKRKLRRR